jgi:hypothetical protein
VLPKEAGSKVHISSGLFGYRRSELLKTLADFRQEKELAPVLVEWPKNGLRHSFGSYFFAKSRNENLTAAEMGNSPSMVYRHYREIVKPTAVDRYWKIVPLADPAYNILPMVAA